MKRAPGLLALLLCISCVHKYAIPEPVALGSILRPGGVVYLARPASRWATFGGDHPQDLLPELSSRWARTLVK